MHRVCDGSLNVCVIAHAVAQANVAMVLCDVCGLAFAYGEEVHVVAHLTLEQPRARPIVCCSH
jgi:hypothetical protein